jgi:hypothetical protein
VTTPNHTNEQMIRDYLNSLDKDDQRWPNVLPCATALQALATSRLADAQERIAAALEVANRIPRR